MEQYLHSPEVYDFRKYDSIWQRVAPGLEPYPASRQYVPAAASAQMPEMAAQGQGSTTSGQMADLQQAALVRQESQLPGASPNPCCMGSAAAEILDVLTGFIEEELEEQRYYLALACQAGSTRQMSDRRMHSVRRQLQELAAEELAHAKRLMAVHYLITGECYHPSISGDRVTIGRWCPALRERYHAAACSGLNYARAAEGTTDPCLSRLLNELSADEYRHADILLAILERSLRR